MHLVSSFWLPLPFLTRREVDRDDQKAELWFLVVLHSLENLCLLLISRWAYNSYPLGQFLIHIVVAIDIFAALFSIINCNTFKVRSFNHIANMHKSKHYMRSMTLTHVVCAKKISNLYQTMYHKSRHIKGQSLSPVRPVTSSCLRRAYISGWVVAGSEAHFPSQRCCWISY